MRFFGALLLSATLSAPTLAQSSSASCGGGTTDRAAFNAASCSLPHSVGATVGQRAYLSLSSANVGMPTATSSSFNSGYVVATSPTTLTVSANFPYVMTASTTAFNTVSGYTKAKSDLEIGLGTASVAPATYSQLGSAVTLTPGGPSSPTAAAPLYLYFRMRLQWAVDRPGTYQTTVTYTLTTP